MSLIAAAVALAIGLSMGLFGGGGSLLLVPAFTLLMGIDAKQAVATSLAVVGISAAAGAVAAVARGVLPVKPAIVTGIATMAGAFGGAIIGARLDDETQLMIFAVVALGAAASLGWQSTIASNQASIERVPRGDGLLTATGIGVGFVTGLIGVGGGFLLVPALVMTAGLKLREAVNVSLFVMVLATTSALAVYSGEVPLTWAFVLPFALVTSAGTIIGGIAGHSLSQRLLQPIFAVALAAVAVFVLIRG
jgi:uncharacterized membrane protein YfcA